MIGKRLFILSFIVFLGLINLNITANASYLSEGEQASGNGSNKLAAKLYKKACDSGFANGCNKLGLSYYNGRGVNQNKIKAYQYWLKAAKTGNSDAQHNLDILCRQSTWACK